MVAHNRRREDDVEELSKPVKLNNWLRHNIHLLLLALPLIWAGAGKLGFVWTGSPQAIVAHVDHADSVLASVMQDEAARIREQDSIMAVAVHGLSDTVSVIWTRQEIQLSVMCQSLSRDAKALIENSIKCSHWTVPQTKANTTGKNSLNADQ